MKAVLTSCQLNQCVDHGTFYGNSHSCKFFVPLHNKWTSDSHIRIEFHDLESPLFRDMDYNDEFEIEIVINKIPKAKIETKVFK
jgi:hypothetical protein